MASLRYPRELIALGEYELITKIGEGSMASVYKGRHRTSGDLVAIKVPPQNVLSEKVLRERFFQEFRAGSNLNHPNIVRTIDFGQEGPVYFLVMEFVEGQDLWERIQEQKLLSEREAVAVIVQIAQALHEAHKQGIIHRDVKPDNILVMADGTAKLADLGLIKELEGGLDLTCPHKGLGTPHFIAPEQFTDARDAGVRCDVYSLGATLYTAVTGTLPFDGRNLSVILRKKQKNDLVAPRDIIPGLSKTVDWAIRRSLQADPQRRQAHCLEFIETLAEEIHTPSRPAHVPRRSSARIKRLRPAKERRISTRYPCTLATVCEMVPSIHTNLGDADHWPSTVVDLSQAGIGLHLTRRFEIGTVVTVLLESSDHSFQKRKDIQVVRTSSAGPKQWFVGATFTEPLERADLKKLL